MFRPLKSAKKPKSMSFEDFLAQLRFPVLATPKVDGIRCRTGEELYGVVRGYTNSNKPIPNDFVRNQIERYCPPWLDSELTVGDNFQSVTSGIMSQDGLPNFHMWVFGCCIDQPELPYEEIVKRLCALRLPAFCHKLLPRRCNNLSELLAYEDWCLANKAEGVMTREPSSPYKYGRSTLTEQHLVAIKRFEDAEGVVVGFVEQLHNANEPTLDAHGLVERSSHSANLVPTGTLGSLTVLADGETFGLGTGFTATLKQRIWNNRQDYLGAIVKFKYQAYGTKDKPRIPVFLGFRHKDDL